MSQELSHFHRLIQTHQQAIANASSEENIKYLLANNAQQFQQYKLFNNLNWRDLFSEKRYGSILPGSLNENIDFLRHAGLKDTELPEFFELYRKKFTEPSSHFMNLYQALMPDSKNASFEEIWKIIPPIENNRAESRIPQYFNIVKQYYPQYIDQTLKFLINKRIEHFETWKKRERDFFVTEAGPNGEGVMLSMYWLDPKHTADLVKWNLYTNDIHGMAMLVVQNRITTSEFLLSASAMKWDTACRTNDRGYSKIVVKEEVISVLPALLAIKDQDAIKKEMQQLIQKHPSISQDLLNACDKADEHGSGFTSWINWVQILLNYSLIDADNIGVQQELNRNVLNMRARIGTMSPNDTHYCVYGNKQSDVIDLLQQKEPWKEVGFWHLLSSASWSKSEEYIQNIDKASLSELKNINVTELLKDKWLYLKEGGYRSQYAKNLFDTLVYLVPYLRPEDKAFIGAYAAIYTTTNPKTLRSYWKDHDPSFGKSIPSSVSNSDYLLYAITRKEPTELHVLGNVSKLSKEQKFDVTHQWLLKTLAPQNALKELDTFDLTAEITI